MPEMHESEPRKLDRLVFGSTGQDGVTLASADALQRSHLGHTQAAICEERWDQH
jgi:hypothetical protein